MSKLVKKVTKFFSRGEEKRTDTSKIKSETQIFDRNEQEKKSSANERKMGLKDKGKLFVGGLNYATTSQELQDYFSQFGEVIDSVVMKYPNSGKSRGFGFVIFAKECDAESVLRKDLHVLDGKIIDVRPSESGRSTSTKGNNFKVFLGGLPDNISPEVLKQFFGRYGEISKVVIPTDKNTKKPRGFGFIWFKDEDTFEKCVAEDFVHLGGRRIHIKRAETRNHSQAQDNTDASVKIGLDRLENNRSSLDDLQDGESTSSLGDNEIGSAVSEERSEKSGRLQQLFEDFFLTKLESPNEMKTEKVNEDFQKLLSEFLIKHGKENSASDEDLIIFSDSESEESNSSTIEDTDPYSDNDASDVDRTVDSENCTNALDDLNTKFAEKLLSLSDWNSADKSPQISVPFKFTDNKGSLFCSLCHWSAEENSCESFLTHCKTNAHRMRLKERFPKVLSEAAGTTEGNEQTDSEKLNSVPQKPPTKIQQRISKEQGRILHQRNVEKSKSQTEVPPNASNVKKKGSVENKNTKKKVQKRRNKTLRVEGRKNLKMMALTKGMAFMSSVSGNELKCSLCNKVIPKALDFSVFMKNVSGHLQSKGHLKKLLETENLLKSSLDKNLEQTKLVKNPPNQKKIQGKPFTQEQKNTPEKTSTREQKIPKQKNFPEGNSTDKTSAQKILFLCIPCNYFSKNIEIFKAHLTSQPHLDSFTSKGLNLDSSLDSFTKCKSCGHFLFGPLYYINKHYTKCSEKKG